VSAAAPQIEQEARVFFDFRAAKDGVTAERFASDFSATRFDPETYIRDRLGWTPWKGVGGGTGQVEVLEAYTLALRQQFERKEYQAGTLRYEEGEAVRTDAEGNETRSRAYWTPGQLIQNWISIDAGHNVGKTRLGAGLVSHFFDSFSPSIIYCFAPSGEQINDLLFKFIRKDRRNKPLPGEVMDEPRIKYKEDHFVKGKATDNATGTGTERTHGQHGEFLMFVLDEAEGIPAFVWEAVRSMASGGICIVLILRNPRTTTCEAHKVRKEPQTAKFRISCLDHPNVIHDRELIPGGVGRDYVESMLRKCEVVAEHSEEDHTFTIPWRPGVIYKPSLVCMWRVLGRASSKGTDDAFCSPDRYEAACEREPYDGDDMTFASVGVDAARYGNDLGTIYVRHAGRVRKEKEIAGQDGYPYYIGAKAVCLKLRAEGVRRVSVRVDGGGGWGSTCIDNLRRDLELQEKLDELRVFEVHNNGTPHDEDKYADLVTEMYFYGAEALKALRLDSPSPNLEQDLCERKFTYVIKTSGNKTRLDLKQLVPKEKFKKLFHRSPDDGDGFVLAVAPDYLFAKPPVKGVFV
jgi:hypothetical protein